MDERSEEAERKRDAQNQKDSRRNGFKTVLLNVEIVFALFPTSIVMFVK